jgi:hypothetical membrane protein
VAKILVINFSLTFFRERKIERGALEIFKDLLHLLAQLAGLIKEEEEKPPNFFFLLFYFLKKKN